MSKLNKPLKQSNNTRKTNKEGQMTSQVKKQCELKEFFNFMLYFYVKYSDDVTIALNTNIRNMTRDV